MSQLRVERECPDCGQVIRLPLEQAGDVLCPTCGKSFFADTRKTESLDSFVPASNPSYPHKLTWAAVLAGVILIIPGAALGALVAAVYRWFLRFFLPGDRWFSAMEWIDRAALHWFPSLLHGLVAGAFAITVAMAIFRRANSEVVSYAVCSAYIAIALVIVAFSFRVVGFSEDWISFTAQFIGLSVGLFLYRRPEVESGAS